MVFTIVDGVVGMAGMLLFVAAVLGVSAALSDGFAGMLTHLGLGLPGFGTEQSGNALYHTYDQLRWASIIILVCAISACAALGRWRGRCGGRRPSCCSSLYSRTCGTMAPRCRTPRGRGY